MSFLKKYKTGLTLITLLVLTNCLTVYFLSSGFIQLPNTITLSNESDEFLTELKKLNQLNRIINKNYIAEVDNQALGENLVDNMFKYLGDTYSEYYSAEEYQSVLQSYSGKFGGIGIVIDSTDPNHFLITSVVEGSPAEKAGIKSGDVLTGVDGENIVGEDIDIVVSKTRGDLGSEVTVTVDREGKSLDFKLKRDNIDSSTVYSENLDGIGYIYISEFGEGTASQFEEAAEELINQNVSGLIIDLRYNGGGLVNRAVEVADQLLDAFEVCHTVNKNGKSQYYKTADGKIDLPFVVLVNEGTASSAEILSGALQKSGATLIGNKTFGKGVIQTMSSLQDKSGYKLTTEEYFLNDGTAVNKVGITPDIMSTPEQSIFTGLDYREDPTIQQALEILKK